MIKAAEMLFKAPESDKPTILLMIDRNELEDQMLKNLAALGLDNVAHANRIKTLVKLLENDYRGIIVTMIHKFRDMPADINLRSNIYVLIDEAHRTTGGDLGNFLMAGLPNATYIGFSGTPIDKTVYGRGTFKTFGLERRQGLSAQVFHFREHCRRHHPAALLQPGPQRDAGQCRADGNRVLGTGRNRGDRRHRGTQQDPGPGGEPEKLS